MALNEDNLSSNIDNVAPTKADLAVRCISKRAVHKRRPHKIAKIDLPPCPHWLEPSPPLSVRIHHKFQKIRSFLRQKVRTSASEDTPPPPPCPKNVRT